MKTVLDELKEWMESTEFYPSHFSVINKIKELKDKEKKQIMDAYNAGKSNVFSSSYNAFWKGEDYFIDTYKTVSK